MSQIEGQPLSSGFHIGVYEITGVLGATPFDITYRGWNHHLNGPVMLTEYFPGANAIRDTDGATVVARTDTDRDDTYAFGLERFVALAEALAAIEHPGIITVHNVLEINGTAYQVMDDMQGMPLAKRLNTTPELSASDLTALLKAALCALDVLHTRDIVHGDIHPSNILLRTDTDPVLTGFAGARLAFAARTNRLQQALRTGYAAPEYDRAEGKPGPAADLYALGATMARALTHADPPPVQKRLTALEKGRPDPLDVYLRTDRKAEYAPLSETVRRLLNPQPESRPDSAADVLANLTKEEDESARSAPRSTSSPASNRAPAQVGVRMGAIVAITVVATAGLWYLFLPHPARHPPRSGDAGTAIKGTINNATSTSEPPSPVAAASATQPPAPGAAQVSGDARAAMPKPATVPAPPTAGTTRSRAIAGPGQAAAEDTKITTTDETNRGTTRSESITTAPAMTRAATDGDADGGVIASHLQAAERAIAELRLTTPEPDNAYRHYQAVLAIAPDNTPARAGIGRIVDIYVWLIDQAMKDNNARLATVYLARARAVAPNDDRLVAFHRRLTARGITPRVDNIANQHRSPVPRPAGP